MTRAATRYVDRDMLGAVWKRQAARLGCDRVSLSRLLNGKAGLSVNMGLALEAIGWGTADHWMRMQASYELAQAHYNQAADGRGRQAVHMTRRGNPTC